jgi:hypothetical protein
VPALLAPATCVLVKGSRRTGLDRFVTATAPPERWPREDAA